MVIHAKSFEDFEQQQVQIADRLRQARESLGFTQGDFASQLSITRERLASYEDSRAPLRCDIALRACRHFFISEFWLAYGSADEQSLRKQERTDFPSLDARLTMSLATEPIGLSLALGTSFDRGFEPHLRSEYSKLAGLHGGFPRVIPLPNDHPAYIKNALDCLMQFWKRGLAPEEWRRFVADLAISGEVLNWQLRQVAPDASGADDLRLFEEQQAAKLAQLRKVWGHRKVT